MVILLLLVALVPTASGQAGVIPIPPNTLAPTDPDGDGKYEDLNANGRKDFADVVLYFNQMTWIASNEPLAAFDFNGNNRIDFADVVALFNDLGATPTPTPTPTVTGIAPVSAYAGRTISATVSGTGFANGIEVALV
ncbi:MAG TPA: dockerin type I domain-containing protein, partial [Methanoregulaceae archaeon]|nr:dockerin type I domain-containing protein [Methanoregulaceae archaeon]